MSVARMTRPVVEVLRLLLKAPADEPLWGTKIVTDADLGSGTVYPILQRLAEDGWIAPREETGPHPGRPARTFYELTETGRRKAEEALAARSLRLRRGGSGKTTAHVSVPGPHPGSVGLDEAPAAGAGPDRVDHAALLDRLVQEGEFVPLSEQGRTELADLVAQPPSGDAPGGYGTVLADTPGFGAGLPAAPEQIRAAGPGVPRLPHVDQDRRPQ
ncbi:PadR family transcriptional regulator [Streptomyces europaeiscabiei]|uniref:PadR family transcriptional regulator n=1 Tax=Streptomyces europaeiscabiei TaxID=146819 RepID=UPI0029A8659E|nr:PadR family transcriptional regulator [Streptomyces europaeiscabiei]MDX3695006.1 PadR family transcriptional regulator [Streptomyces europaeiscabiei]